MQYAVFFAVIILIRFAAQIFAAAIFHGAQLKACTANL
jgi:hypothetical protein